MTSDSEMAEFDRRHAYEALHRAQNAHRKEEERLQKACDAAEEKLKRARTREQLYEVECPLSQRVDGKLHSWRWDGDDPRVVCSFCGEVRDSLSGRVLIEGRRSEKVPA